MIRINSWRFRSENLHFFFILGFTVEELKEISIYSFFTRHNFDKISYTEVSVE